MADLFYCEIQLSAYQINSILRLWSTSGVRTGTPSTAPFQNHKELYQTIDRTPLGDIPWSSFSLRYDGERPMDDVPQWMDVLYQVSYHDPQAIIQSMLANPSLKDNMDYVPYREYDASNEKWSWQDFMSGDWAWSQAVRFSYLFSVCMLYSMMIG